SSLVATGMMPRSPPTWATSPAPAATSAIATAIRTHGRRAVGVLGRARLGIGEIGGLLPNGEWKSKRERIKRSAMSANDSYTYAKAGVSIDAGNALVKAIGPLVKATRRPGADAEIGGFGGFFDPKAAGYADPLLVAANDGVGTKVKLAIDHDRHDAIGIDLVAMCANDLVVQGAEPLFFLDYFATGKLDTGVAERVIAGIAEGCRIAGCAL